MPVKTILSVSAIVLLTSCSDSANPDTSDGSTEQLKTSYSTHKAACDDLQQKKTCQGTPCDETWLDEAGTVAEFASCLCDWLEVYGCAEWAKPPTTPSICHDKLLTESGSYAPVTASCFVTGP